jgi:fluoride exporter
VPEPFLRCLLVIAGGGVGSLARYLAGAAILHRFGPRHPLGTLFVNITGSFLIGLLMTFLTDRLAHSANLRLLLVVGFLGGYTTFSSFEWETYFAVQTGSRWFGLANVVGSVTLGYAAVWLGATLGRR